VSASSIEGQGEASQDPAVIPFTAPIHDDLGRLTYLGSDGRRYVVADPPPPPGPPAPRDPDLVDGSAASGPHLPDGAQEQDDHTPPG
jgi:hypothetical protein